MTLTIDRLERQAWPLRAVFTISRGSSSEAELLYLRLRRGAHVGHAECVPYHHYGESFDSVEEQVRRAAGALAESGAPTEACRVALQSLLPAGAARNAVDCALWDLDCKERGRRAWELAGRTQPERATTVETIVIDSVDAMRAAAARSSHRPILKVKLDAELVLPRMRAVREGAPRSRLVVDANEAWDLASLATWAPELAALGVEMIEQPLPAGRDDALDGFDSPIALCADESCHTRADLERCASRYRMVNVKLDKTGGLTEALALVDAALQRGLGLMVGCMLGTSLGMAPATMFADRAAVVDLDGPLWLRADRDAALTFDDSLVGLPTPGLWG